MVDGEYQEIEELINSEENNNNSHSYVSSDFNFNCEPDIRIKNE